MQRLAKFLYNCTVVLYNFRVDFWGELYRWHLPKDVYNRYVDFYNAQVDAYNAEVDAPHLHASKEDNDLR